MSATRAAALLALLAIACPTSAQDRARQGPPQRILRRPPVAVEPPPSGHFELTCVRIRSMSASSGSFSFGCQDPLGSAVVLTVAHTYDETGEYAVGFEAGVEQALQDESRLLAVTTTVQTFALLKAVQPNSSLTLHVTGIESRAPAAQRGARVLTVQIRE